MPVASAQVKSSLLLAGLYADSPVTVVEPMRSRDHTERMLAAMGARVARDGNAVTVAPCGRLDPLEMTVPGDLSSAAFFLVLAAVTPGSTLTLIGVGMNPFRTGLLDVLRRMGARIRPVGERIEGGNRWRTWSLEVRISSPRTLPGRGPGPDRRSPGPVRRGRLRRRPDGDPRRGRAARQGVGPDRGDGRLSLLPRNPLRGIPGRSLGGGAGDGAPAGPCDSRGDHRIAMSLRILGAAAGVPVEVTDVDCIDTSFPGFQPLLEGLTR